MDGNTSVNGIGGNEQGIRQDITVITEHGNEDIISDPQRYSIILSSDNYGDYCK
jgi:hypothetical protein